LNGGSAVPLACCPQPVVVQFHPDCRLPTTLPLLLQPDLQLTYASRCLPCLNGHDKDYRFP
jgi:hypothetical protein